MNMNDLLTIETSKDGTKVMSSREIATKTGKRHDHVLRDIENMLSELEIGQPKFGGTYLDAQGKERKEYLLPERECLILAAGYSIQLRAKIIDSWKAMTKAIQQQVSEPMSQVDILLQNVMLLKQHEEAIKALDKRTSVLEAKATTVPKDFYSVAGYASLKGLKLPTALAQQLGIQCAKQSKQQGYTIGKVPDERHGKVNTYHTDILDEVFTQWENTGRAKPSKSVSQ